MASSTIVTTVRSRTRSVSPGPRRVHFCDWVCESDNRPVVKYGPRRWQHLAWEQKLNALLADLQNTVPSVNTTSNQSSGYGSLNTPRGMRKSPVDYSVPITKYDASAHSNSSVYGRTQELERKPFSNNLSELDNLLQDLSNSQAANMTGNGILSCSRHNSCSPKSVSTCSSTHSTLNRRTVDSLLDELNTEEVLYAGPRKVTITVKETKTESGLPITCTESIQSSSHVSTMSSCGGANVASTATRELDDLMASLSGIKKCVTAMDKTWHMEHFFCAQCGKQFGEDGFHEREGKPYCREDYYDMFAPKCGACARAIMENYISALNSQWHPDCFVCRDCRQPFIGGSFFDHDGQPYCETHYHLKRGSLCAGCHKPISGRCITAMFRKFHPEHFVCAFCLKQLNKGTFKEQNDKPYCHICFDKLFG